MSKDLVRRMSHTGDTLDFGIEESESGVGWKYTSEGCALVSRSVREAASTSQEAELSRRLYVDGVAYFMRGLPTNLTAEETVRLSACLPPQLDPVAWPDTAETTDSSTPEDRTTEPADIVRRSMIRQVMAKTTIYAALVIRLALPYVQRFSTQLYRYDRRYRISDRVLVISTVVLGTLWKCMVGVVNHISAFDDGRLVEALGEFARYLGQEVSSGLYDSVSEALHLQTD